MPSAHLCFLCLLGGNSKILSVGSLSSEACSELAMVPHFGPWFCLSSLRSG